MMSKAVYKAVDIRQWGWENGTFYWMVDGALRTREETIRQLQELGYDQEEIEILLEL